VKKEARREGDMQKLNQKVVCEKVPEDLSVYDLNVIVYQVIQPSHYEVEIINRKEVYLLYGWC
jgi:hypothetical protein